MSTNLSRVIELTINGDLPGGANSLLRSKTSGDSIQSRPRFIAGDRFTLRLYFRKPSTSIGSPSTVYSLQTPFRLIMVGKKDDPAITGSDLFSSSEWIQIGTGDAVYYEAILDLDTAAIQSLFSAGSEDVPVAVDLKYGNDTDSERLTWRLDVTLCRRVYVGSGILPSTLSTSYLQSQNGSTWQITISDAGQMNAPALISQQDRDPDFLIIQQAIFASLPSGYYYEFTVDDAGQLSSRRIT
jgi:hypothetical protein